MKTGRYDDDTAFTLADDAATIARIVRTVPAERLRTEMFDRWSALEVIGHIADISEVYADRVRRVLSEDRPFLRSVDPDVLAAERKNNERDPMALAKRIQAAHGEIVRSLAAAPGRVRVGLHEEHGEMDAAYIAAYHAQHAHEHAADLAGRFPPTA